MLAGVVSTSPGRSQPWSAVVERSGCYPHQPAPSARQTRRTAPDPRSRATSRRWPQEESKSHCVSEDESPSPASFISWMVASNSASSPVAFTFCAIPQLAWRYRDFTHWTPRGCFSRRPASAARSCRHGSHRQVVTAPGTAGAIGFVAHERTSNHAGPML